MAHIVRMPQLGLTEESAVLTAWHVKAGDTIQIGAPLFSLETGKASFEVEAEAAGMVLALFCEEGDEKPIKEPVCAIGQPGETVDFPGGQVLQPSAASDDQQGTQPPKPSDDQQRAQPSAAPDDKQGVQTSAAVNSGQTSQASSPRAKMLAAKLDIDLSRAVPTGPEGRIIERDVYRLAELGPADACQTQSQPAATEEAEAQPDYTDVPHTLIRRNIAKSMTHSLATLAQLTHHSSFDATELLALRALCKQSPETAGVTIGDLVLYAAARTLLRHPDLNAHYYDSFLRRFQRVNIGVAVDTPAGLMVPTLPNAGECRVTELSAKRREIAESCKKGTPPAGEAATFTVSNLGNLGVEMFTPVINPPQVAILGVCAIVNRLRGDGTVYPAMGLSLTYDHRAVDGAPASRFLMDLCKGLENINLLLL